MRTGAILCGLVLVLGSSLLSAAAIPDWDAWLERSRVEAGDPEFDLAFGVAAIEAGHPEQAVFALERVLMMQPWNHRARLELGRARYALGEYSRARAAFRAVLAAGPPQAVADKARAWLEAIERSRSRSGAGFHSRVGVFAGVDSNVNAATSSDRIEIPALGTFLLDDSARRRSDQYRLVEFSGEGSLPLDQHQSLFLGLGVSDRSNFSSRDFDLRIESVRVGWRLEQGTGRLRIPLDIQWVQVADRAWRRLVLAGAAWSGRIGTSTVHLGFQAGNQSYARTPVRDTRVVILQGATPLSLPGGAALLASVNLGREFPRHDEGGHYGRRYAGVGLEWRGALPDAWNLRIQADLQRALHDEADPVFSSTRRETWMALRLTAERPLGRAGRLQVEASLADNDSSLDFYAYRRARVALGWMLDWP